MNGEASPLTNRKDLPGTIQNKGSYRWKMAGGGAVSNKSVDCFRKSHLPLGEARGLSCRPPHEC